METVVKRNFFGGETWKTDIFWNADWRNIWEIHVNYVYSKLSHRCNIKLLWHSIEMYVWLYRLYVSSFLYVSFLLSSHFILYPHYSTHICFGSPFLDEKNPVNFRPHQCIQACERMVARQVGGERQGMARDRKHERFPQMVVIVREMGPLISGKSRLVNYYNLSRIDELKNDFEWLLKNTFSYKWVIFSVWTVRGTNWRHAI